MARAVGAGKDDVLLAYEVPVEVAAHYVAGDEELECALDAAVLECVEVGENGRLDALRIVDAVGYVAVLHLDFGLLQAQFLGLPFHFLFEQFLLLAQYFLAFLLASAFHDQHHDG